jgi:hypothetical protein
MSKINGDKARYQRQRKARARRRNRWRELREAAQKQPTATPKEQ